MPARSDVQDEVQAHIVRLYLDGLSVPSVAKSVGLGPYVVTRILKEKNVALRNQSEAAAIRPCDSGNNTKHGIKSVFFSAKNNQWIPTGSLLEYIRLFQLEGDSDVASFSRCGDLISYHHTGKTRRYNPDFLVVTVDGRKRIEEVKPERMLKNEQVQVKASAARAFYKDKAEYVFVTEKTMGKSFVRGFSATGLLSIQLEELDTVRRERSRERNRLFARKKRAERPLTPEQKAARVKEVADYRRRWLAKATPEQIAEQKAKRTAQARVRRAAKRMEAANDNFQLEEFAVKTSQ